VIGPTGLRAGIVHRDIEATEACDGPVDQFAYFVLATDVGADELGGGAERAQLCRQLPAGFFTRPATREAPPVAKATAVARPSRFSAPVIKTTGLLMFQSFQVWPSPAAAASDPELGSAGAAEKDFVGWGHTLQAWENMELRHLRYFVAVAEAKSITVAAARRLRTAQPSLASASRAGNRGWRRADDP